MRGLRSSGVAAAVALLALIAYLVLRGGSPAPVGRESPPAPSPTGPGVAPAEEPPGAAGGPLLTVLRVVDGDTIWVTGEERVRLIGIDTPEVDWYGGQAECYGDEAGLFVRGLLRGERVHLEFDRDRTDRYGRTLAYVYLEDGRMLNVLLARRGYGRVAIYAPNDRHEAALRAAERSARAAGRGLWGACDS